MRRRENWFERNWAIRSFVRGFAPDFCVIDAEIFMDVHGVAVVYSPLIKSTWLRE